jgi:putative serine protease PepD
VAVGAWVRAVGSPFGLEKSVSTGVVSALFRSTTMESETGVNIYANMIQTDAAINPGNSGGALVNAEGKLIGINTLISSATGSSSGVGFAIPSKYALNVASQIMDGKTVEHAYLGVTVVTVDPNSQRSLGVSIDHGAYIDSVVVSSPADKAGIKEGDVITKIGGQPVATNAELIINVRGHLVGDEVEIVLNRNGEEITVKATLGADSQSPSRQQSESDSGR